LTGVTQILASIERGDPHAAEQLLPLVYEELRKLAAVRMAQEAPGQTLQPTALVHEAYVRLVEGNGFGQWDSRGHFFAAAAEAMRRILVEQARRKRSLKRGGRQHQTDLDAIEVSVDAPGDDLLALNEAIERLERLDAVKAELVKLRFFAGLTVPEAAHVLGISTSTADNYWAYARCWLRLEVLGNSSD
jgi:RNA polymerase sigma factor (TIGR02999 family)